jgi:hypothetical protein
MYNVITHREFLNAETKGGLAGLPSEKIMDTLGLLFLLVENYAVDARGVRRSQAPRDGYCQGSFYTDGLERLGVHNGE